MFLDQKTLTLLAVIEEGGITRAAARLHLTQPAVSTQVKEMERELGLQLFSRSGRALVPTDAALGLYEKCLVMRNDAEKIRASLAAAGSRGRSYRFGATLTVGEYVIPGPLARLLRRDRALGATLIIGNTVHLLEELRNGTIDFALVEGSVPPGGLEIRRFSSVPFIGVCHAGHPLPPGPITLRSLLGECLVCREEGSGTRNILESRLAGENLTISSFKRVVVAGGMHAILLMLREDLGISFMYAPAAQAYIEAGSLRQIEIADFAIHHDFSFVWQKGSALADEYEAFMSGLLGCC
ncbi:MAG: LysR family transcriptional regulator [Succinivibrionaceae bacterium]|nr:LysR family transcriptional regulator [Succinivibrionaceae bacterium]